MANPAPKKKRALPSEEHFQEVKESADSIATSAQVLAPAFSAQPEEVDGHTEAGTLRAAPKAKSDPYLPPAHAGGAVFQLATQPKGL